jgi:formate hydrogenlyase subunit 3/multisubunit Na+/H+ antiporter MnhD subunit
MLAFFLFFGKAGTFDFDVIRSTTLSPAVRDIIFVLAFLGFGAKAGMCPSLRTDTYAAAAMFRGDVWHEEDRNLPCPAHLRDLWADR